MSSKIVNTFSATNSDLAEYVARITVRLEAGEPINLRELCADSPQHLERLESLLPTVQAMVDLGHGAHRVASVVDTTSENSEIRSLLGDFRIIRELGRGGMGVVYEAEQLSLGRCVALKVLPFAAMLDKQQLNRFKNEARAAATLDHPNIVAIYSVGVDRGVHYYAMQLIEGRSLAEIIATMKPGCPGLKEDMSEKAVFNASSAADGTARLAQFTVHSEDGTAVSSTITAPYCSLSDFSSPKRFRAIAKLGVQAAEALDHAHQNGILHRDIKPANLLVGDAGKLWITDFGLARIERDAGMTMTGDLLGTLRYMSPEQLLAQRVVVDHRSDIYSLGVTLYELLTLETAFTGNDRQELLRQIAFDEPRKPRHVNPRIPHDLETVVLKSIQKNPSDRYTTSRELADDLLRFINNQPVRAKRPNLFGVARRWSRRHRPLVVLAAVSCALLVGAVMLVLTVSNARIRQEAAAKETALDQKDAALAVARSVVDEMYTGMAEAWLEQQPGRTDIQRVYLEKALAFYQNFAQQQVSDPQVLQKSVQALLRVGSIQHKLGKRTEAATTVAQAVKHSTDLVLTYPDRPEFLFDLVAGHLELAALYRETGRINEAKGEIDSTKAQLIALRELPSTNLTARQQLGISLDNLARELVFDRRQPEAEAVSQSALKVWEELVHEFPNQEEYRVFLADHYKSYGEHVDWWGGNEEKAEEALQKAVALLYRQNIDHVQVRRNLSKALATLAVKLSSADRDAVAQKMNSRAEILTEDLVADFPEIIEYQEQLAKLLHEIAALDLRHSRFQNAEARSRRALALYEKLVDRCPDVPAYELMVDACEFQLVLALTKQEKYEEALRVCEQGLSKPLKHDLGTGYDLRNRTGMDVVDLAWDTIAAVIDADIAQQASVSGNSHSAFETAQSSAPTGTDVNDQVTKRSLIRAVTELMLLRARDEGRQGGVACLLSLAPEGLRDPEFGLQFAQRVTEGDPQALDSRQMLCAALFRMGDWKGAIEMVPPDDPPAQLVLAIAHWKLGDRDKARTCFDRGSRWLGVFEKNYSEYYHYPTPAMFKLLQAEAATMLGITPTSAEHAPQAGPNRSVHPNN